MPQSPHAHAVRFVGDEVLPGDAHWLVAQVDGQTYCLLERSHICPAVLEEAWAGYRALVD